jgi:hypothetical protein
MTLLRLLLLASLSACAPSEQSPEPKSPNDVQLVKTVPPSTCKELGDLVGEAPNGPDAESKAKKNLREKAAQMGGNYVRWDTLQISEDPPRTTITGTAYLCPTGSSSEGATPPAR